jgi:hypothetical protein
VTSTRAGGPPKGRPAHPSLTLTRPASPPKGRLARQGPTDPQARRVSVTTPSGGPPRRRTRIPRAVRLMRTISAVLGLVGVILVMTNLPTHSSMNRALGQPLAAPCQPGSPTRMSIPALGVDAPIERIGLDRRARPDDSGQAPLGAPVNKRKAGWYAAGPKPGSGTGTVLTNGHTYRDGSAIFHEDFAALVAVGQRIDLLLDNGTTCSYSISTVWRNVDAVLDYPQLVASERLYNQQGPERLFLATCGGPWVESARMFKDINVVLAIPLSS